MFEQITAKCLQRNFIEQIMTGYHFFPGETASLQRVARALFERMRGEALWDHNIFRNDEGGVMSRVVMTLGPGVDALQEEYTLQGKLTESYMVEVLAGELLLLAYKAYNEWVATHTVYHVGRYYFLADVPGVDPAYHIRELPGFLKQVDVPVTCNEAYCMLPRKSVAFYAKLTEEEVDCPGVCMDCGRLDCPNRMAHTKQKMWDLADLIHRPLPYGYEQILGKWEGSGER